MIKWLCRRIDAALQKKILDLKSTIEERDRTINVQQAEIDSLAAVIARDRARIEAETAIHNRQKANAEGMNEQQLDESIRRFTA